MKITQLRHAYPEFAGFCIDRRNGHEDYTFLHFFGPMTVLTRDGYVKTPPNACIIYAPAEPQFFRSDEKVIHDWIHFSGDDAKDALEKLGIETDVLYYPQRTEFITDLTRNLEREFFSDKTGRTRMLEIKFDELLIRFAREIGGETSHVDPETKAKFSALRQTVFSSLGNAWTVADMAKEVALSESRFFTVYRTVFGMSPVSDLIAARTNAAKFMLTSGNQPIGEIARALGYANVTHFIRQFKAAEGVSPSLYRKSVT